nr:HAMP domain-containing histidine kinase [Eubacterium sp.]
MKLWQKVYLVTMLLFVVLLNVGMYVVFEMTYQKDIATEQKQAEAEYGMLTMGIVRSFRSLDQQGDVTDEKLQSVIEVYENYYDDIALKLTLWRGDDCIYPEGATASKDWGSAEGKTELVVSGDKKKNIKIQGELYQNEATYFLRYEKELVDLYEGWNKLEIKYMVISFVFSIVLAVLLFIVLRKTMKPMVHLSKVVDDMAAGEWESRAYVKGSDEVASLARHFNRMADRIQENIELIQKEADAKQEFIDNFAHELKSPLTSIYGFAEYVQKANVSEDEKIQCMSYIMEESQRLLQLSYTLLNMAQIRNEEIVKEEIPFPTIQEQVQNRMSHLSEENAVALACETGVASVYANEVLLYSLLGNLIQNAIYACDNGGNVVWGAEDVGEKIRLYVEDDGCGMSKEQVERVREPFYRVDKARSRGQGRAGLGLALCTQIVKYHDGDMDIQSEIGHGTKIFVSLPKCFTS